jgi:hypothetical protein
MAEPCCGANTTGVPPPGPGPEPARQGDCCCGPPPAPRDVRRPTTDLPFVTGSVETPAGPVPRVCTRFRPRDRWGAFKVRWGFGRMRYSIPPGLYAAGRPDQDSDVLVTANFKLTFDVLRRALRGRDLWILVLDTRGINVWCAAGKGTFGTREIVERIDATRLREVVRHRRLILPQLAAPGVAAHMVKQLSGFRVLYGPIAAADLPAYLDAGRRATDGMRRKRFDLRERAALIPVELVGALKVMVFLIPAFVLLAAALSPAGFAEGIRGEGALAGWSLLAALVAGCVLVPLLLPWLPGRAFSLKSLPVGMAAALGILAWRLEDLSTWTARLDALAWLLIVPAIAAFIAMNYTGASTYTSLSGVRREIRLAVPIQTAAGALGLALWTAARLIPWGAA